MTRAELAERVIEAAREWSAAELSATESVAERKRYYRACSALVNALSALSAAPAADGWRPDRPGWYWVRLSAVEKWTPAEWRLYPRSGKGKWLCGIDPIDSVFEIGPALLPPPAPREGGEP